MVKIEIKDLSEQQQIKVRTKRKLKLTERYPQRVVIEERKRQNRNKKDYVDYDYYEQALKYYEAVTAKKLDEKHAPKGADKLKRIKGLV